MGTSADARTPSGRDAPGPRNSRDVGEQLKRRLTASDSIGVRASAGRRADARSHVPATCPERRPEMSRNESN
jgi:hypothetical protein